MFPIFDRPGTDTIRRPSPSSVILQGGIVPRRDPIKPLGGPFRRWHLTPWKTTQATALLDDLSGMGDGEDDGSDTTGLDVLNNLITQAGGIFGSRSGMVVPRPKPGQMVPAGSGTMLGMSTNTMLLAGAAVLGVVLLMKKK
jgi:hypothetical protein